MRARSGEHSFSLWEKVAGHSPSKDGRSDERPMAGRMRVGAAIERREAGARMVSGWSKLRPALGAGALIRRHSPSQDGRSSERPLAPPSPKGRRGSMIVIALGLAAALGGCNPAGYPSCFRVECPYPPVYSASYAGYVPAYAPGRPAFGDPPWDDPFADYTWRGVTVSPSAGNAQAANAALQTATPWPRYSSNTNIPGNGANMVRAVQQYESGTRPGLGGGGGGGRRPNGRRAVAAAVQRIRNFAQGAWHGGTLVLLLFEPLSTYPPKGLGVGAADAPPKGAQRGLAAAARHKIDPVRTLST